MKFATIGLVVLVVAVAVALSHNGSSEPVKQSPRSAETGELIPLLETQSDIEWRFQATRSPQGLPITEVVQGEGRSGEATLRFALMVWSASSTLTGIDAMWAPIIPGAKLDYFQANVTAYSNFIEQARELEGSATFDDLATINEAIERAVASATPALAASDAPGHRRLLTPTSDRRTAGVDRIKRKLVGPEQLKSRLTTTIGGIEWSAQRTTHAGKSLGGRLSVDGKSPVKFEIFAAKSFESALPSNLIRYEARSADRSLSYTFKGVKNNVVYAVYVPDDVSGSDTYPDETISKLDQAIATAANG